MSEASYLAEEGRAAVLSFYKKQRPTFTKEMWETFVLSFRVFMLQELGYDLRDKITYTLLNHHAMIFDETMLPRLVKDAFGIGDYTPGCFAISTETRFGMGPTGRSGGIREVSISIEKGIFRAMIYSSALEEETIRQEVISVEEEEEKEEGCSKEPSPSLSQRETVELFFKECCLKNKGAGPSQSMFAQEVFFVYLAWAADKMVPGMEKDDDDSSVSTPEARITVCYDLLEFTRFLESKLASNQKVSELYTSTEKHIVIQNFKCRFNGFNFPLPHLKLQEPEKYNPEVRQSKRPRRNPHPQ